MNSSLKLEIFKNMIVQSIMSLAIKMILLIMKLLKHKVNSLTMMLSYRIIWAEMAMMN
jgi:hypothetical protein